MCHIKNPCVYKWHLSAIVPWTDIKPDFSWFSGAVSVKARLFARVTGGEVCGALDAAVEWVLVDASTCGGEGKEPCRAQPLLGGA